MMYQVYIIKCRDGTFYTGIAKDVRARIEQHNAGKGARYTRGRGPVKLVHTESFESRGEALRRENEIKKLSRIKKMELTEPGS